MQFDQCYKWVWQILLVAFPATVLLFFVVEGILILFKLAG
jgi:hypothetical protein